MTRLRQLRGDRNERNFRATIDAMQPWDSEQDSHARVVASGRFPVKPVQKQDEENSPAWCRSRRSSCAAGQGIATRSFEKCRRVS